MTQQQFYHRGSQEIQLNRGQRRLTPWVAEMERLRDSIQGGFQRVWDVTGGGKVLALPEEYDQNPVLDPPVDRAYYPTLLYFADGFDIAGTAYKYVCLHSSDVDAGGGIIISGSNDFTTWTRLNGGNPVVGLPSGAHHSQVVQTGASSFRIYYWDTSQLYSVQAIRTAESSDLLNWSNDQPLQNGAVPIVTGTHPDWNRGSYGPCAVIYNSGASNSGSNPYDYSYVLFFDGTTGAFESIGLGYSPDGVTFSLYNKVLDHGSTVWGNPVPWDSSYVGACSVFRTTLGKWMMFYSGGAGALHEGIGVAVSDDGLDWAKLTIQGPLFGRVSGTWREQRCYTPSAVVDFENRFSGAGDEADVKLLVSGRDSSGNYTCGYFSIPWMYADVTEALYRLGRL